jgi:hypothetical protein
LDLGGHNWHAWKNTNGQTENMRKHLHEAHWPVYRELVISNKLKGWEAVAQGEVPEVAGGSQRPEPARKPFSLKGFYSRLLKWVSVDDQASFMV